MTTQKPTSVDVDMEELKQFSMELQQGLEQMIDFEQELNRFNKSTLILFIVLNLEEEQFERAQKILDKLEPLADNSGIAGF